MNVFHVREATAEDREEVLRIHDNVYYGLDYIQSYYDYFVSSQHTTPFVLLHNDKIVSVIKSCFGRECEYNHLHFKCNYLDKSLNLRHSSYPMNLKVSSDSLHVLYTTIHVFYRVIMTAWLLCSVANQNR